ncbi:MAG TPA: hypothetical protein VGM20_00200 [Gemmatimonadales bacterium]|jgi:hypothetical protein
MRRALLLILLLALPGHTPLCAQWSATLLGGSITSRGDARDALDPDHPEIRADRLAVVTVAIGRTIGRWRVGLEGRHAGADLSEASAAAVVTTPGVLSAWGAGFEVATRIVGRAPRPSLEVALGAGADRWSFDLSDDSPRWRSTLRGALEASLPLGGRWDAVIRGEVTRSPSIFRTAELPEGFQSLTAWRRGVVLGIRRRW